jgi:hypothetical protein
MLIVGWKLMSAMAVALGLLWPRARCAEAALACLPPGFVGAVVVDGVDDVPLAVEVVCPLVPLWLVVAFCA